MSYEIFNKHAKRYDEWYYKNRKIAELELRLLKEFVKEDPSLEIGVGSGFFASKLNINVGLDPAINMLKLAKDRGVDVVLGIGERMPFRSNAFRTAYIIVTLCFVERPRELLNNVKSVLIDNGKLIVCIVPKNSPWGIFYVKKARKGHVFYSIARFYTIEEVVKMLEEEGFKVVRIRGILSFSPQDEIRNEFPSNATKKHSFVCIEAVKV
ncbi:MAG: class I SAM-dependent methyltransferase [Thermoprotei archaeon]|nr:MAG: class I SAM-dependent methyltransferase [Thermoprotei archaeon]